MNESKNTLFDDINSAISNWNPIGVPEEISKVEYVSYVNKIIDVLRQKQDLTKYLESLLVDTIGLDYSPLNSTHKKYVIKISKTVSEIFYKMDNR